MSIPPSHQPWYRRFQGLMPFRVREILLVSSYYDAFVLEEDGPLTERLFSGYSELNLTSAPRITHVRTGAQACRAIEDRRFDLVMTVARVEDTDAVELSRAVAEREPQLPVVLLTFDEADLEAFPAGAHRRAGLAFLWTGDARGLIAAIKLVEDSRNVDHDTRAAGVQVILVVEDSVRAYSSFIARLYPELMRQSQSLILEGGNDLHRLIRMRARPRILLASDYEQAVELAERHRENLLALITDVRFPRAGVEEPAAGLELVRELRERSPELAVLLLSAEPDLPAHARTLDTWHVEKQSASLAHELRSFLEVALGFGDFVFRMPDGHEVDRARNVYEMERALARAPAESIAYHAQHHHFSVWLKARGMFDLAASIRPLTMKEFPTVEDVRGFLVDVVRRAREYEQEGTISDVSAPTGAQNRFVRVGRGSIGGKGRGIAFVNELIARHRLLTRFAGLQIRVPKTVVLGADEFERFVRREDYEAAAMGDAGLHARLLSRALSPTAETDLRVAIGALKGPLAVRSSSVLEDSRFRPFAGVYATYVLPNNHPEPGARFRQLCDAVRSVFASVFSDSARTYLAGTPHSLEEQRMAVVIQQVVGTRYGDRYYPIVSGVAQSWNHYPIGGQRPEEGVASIALGLGHQVVGGGASLRFSPAAPGVQTPRASARDLVRASQSSFFALDLARTEVDPLAAPTSTLVKLPLEAAEADGVLGEVASVYVPQDDVLRDSLAEQGPRVVTFANVLRWRSFPLAEALAQILELLRDAAGGEVEIEMAVDRPARLPDGSVRDPRLFVLQLRPLPPRPAGMHVALDHWPRDARVIASSRALGDGLIGELRDVVYVRRADLGPDETRRAAREVRSVVEDVRGRPFVLIGPGRWGTSDPNLGVPVDWRDIAGVRVIVETPLAGRHVEPSQGSHFFRNVVADRVGYLAIAPGTDDRFDQGFFDSVSAASETDLVRHVMVDPPLLAAIDGRTGRALVVPASALEEEMAEEEWRAIDAPAAGPKNGVR